jgi:leucyl aminopeptidase
MTMYADTTLRAYDPALWAQATPILALATTELDPWLPAQPPRRRQWVQSVGFEAEAGTLCFVPDLEAGLDGILVGTGEHSDPWSFGALPQGLPVGEYRIEPQQGAPDPNRCTLAWGLGAYRFERYKSHDRERPRLVVPQGVDHGAVEALVQAVYRVRDLINTPAGDMMPEHLAQAVAELAGLHQAQVQELVGEALLHENYPAIHAVGRASAHAPRLIDLRWGQLDAPRLTLVGKGVCFDSGGLDLKPANGMRLMKKDMGGAAHVIGLASLIMAAGLAVRLRVLIPAVENAVSGNAFRPGDVLRARNGKSIEIENTDAEGRLVLCDALVEAASEGPELIVDFATLTGAARVALGTELPALFSHSRTLADELVAASQRVDDPVWPLPLHEPYRAQLHSPIADLSNCTSEPYGGAITAALFLREFVPQEIDWVHLDVMGWNTRKRPARPEGGEAMGMRAVFAYLQRRFGTHA